MATTYDGINYFPIAVNFMEENAMEVIEAKYGMKGLAIVLKLLCKIYKEGYYIPWGEEQCLIFANKTGKEADAEEVQGIIEIMIEKGMIDRGSYAEHKVLTSEAIQKVWIEATKRRKRNWTAMPYLLIKPKETCNEEKTVCTQNVEQDAGSDAKNACNTEQSKVKQSKKNTNVFFVANGEPPATPPRKLIPEDSFEMRCVNCLIDALVKDMPGAKVPKTAAERQKWAAEIEKMKRIDKRSEEEIQKALNYAVMDSFWKTNIRSTGKFRKQFETLLLQSRQRTDRNRQQAAPKNRFHNLEEHGYDYDKMVWDMANRSGLG